MVSKTNSKRKRTAKEMLVESLAKRHGKGFKRTRKEWENSIADHIGKFIDRLQLKHVSDLLPYLFAAYAGFKAVPAEMTITDPETGEVKKVPTPLESRLMGAGVGTLGLKLASSPNLIAGGVGVGTLAVLGLCNIPQQWVEDLYAASLPQYPDWWPFKYPPEFPKYR